MRNSFTKKVTARYAVCATKGTIETKESIKITWEIVDNMFVAKVDGIDYAIVDDVSDEDELNLDNIGKWIDDTYHDEDYKSSAYEPPHISKKEVNSW